MVSYPALNIVDIVIDEIALEGLDGITLEALWKRLSLRLHTTLPFSKDFIEQTWAICQGVDGLDYYKLPNPREKFIPFDRYEFVDPDFGTILEPDNIPDDIYPHFPIDDAEFGIKGSCSTYKTRKIITEYVKTLNVHQAFEEFGESLAIVASQEIRERALTGDGICPTLELTMMQYCFLERVGRSRYQGEVTQGRISLGLLKEDPKSLFYHRKFLLDHKLITKQIHHQKASGHSCSGSLLHLPRFYVERKPKVIFLAEQVIEILKSKVNCVAEYDEIKKELQIENSIKKLFRSAFFQKVVKTDLRVPYRTIYPKAGEREWQQKNNPSKEKSIRVVQLLDPNMDVSELWGKDEVNDDDEPFELDISELKLNVPLLKQANQIVELSGNEGISQCQLAKIMGQTKLQARTILRNLVKLKIVATYMNDVGRQRVTKFVSKRYEKNSEMSKQFEQQMDRIKELTKSTDTKQQNIDNSSPIERKESINNVEAENEAETEKSLTSKEEISMLDDSNVEKISREERSTDINEENKSAESIIEDKNISTTKMKFAIVNKILLKYGLTKFLRKYKITFGKKSSRSDPVKVDLWNANKDFELKVDCVRTGVEVLEEQSKKLANLKTVDQAEAISYYDSIDVKLVEQRPQHRLGRPASQVIGFMEDLDIDERKNVRSVTYRLLKRANMIIEAVNEHKVIDDLTKLIKMINEEEDREGYDVKIDKKSILRLLQKLAKDNLVKNIKLTLRMNNREKNLTFICDPSIGTDHSVIQSAVEQAKIKFCLLGSQKIRSIIQKQSQQNEDGTKKIFEEDKKGLEAFNTSKKSKSSTLNFQYDFKAGKRYGYSPKFVRMQMLHTFLFYLIYDHPGEPKSTKEMNIKNLRQNGYKIDEKFEDEMSTIYNNNVGWKMFVPPLTRHAGYPLGWALMCDVLLRMPLSIFVKIHNVQFSIPELIDYLNHPIRKHYLVKNLPSHIRNVLLSARKYIHKIHESVTRLCYMGLIQFGPQKLKEKDQVFIYLNKRSEIMDTTSSAAGYHKIENKDYPKTSYLFDSNQIVDKYWYDMWNTCINTYLGDRLAVQGKDILLEELSRKTDMIETVKARKPDEAVIFDTGKVPGDRRGAAGVDSAFFSHLKRNWNWGMSDVINQKYDKTNKRNIEQKQRHEHLSKIKAKPLKFTEFSGLKKVTGPATQHATELRKKLNSSNKIIEENINDKKYEKLVSNHVARQKSFVRKVLPRKINPRLKVKYDDVDFCALQQMDKLRVDWNPHEDNILLMCKVAMMYLCPNPRKQLITFTAVRDILRTYSSNSYNKTSRACQRRLLYMYRKPETFNSVSLGVEEIKQNYYINKRFGGIIERLKDECQNNNEYEKRIVNVFKELVTYIDKRYYNISDMIESRESVIMPKTIQEFNILYRLKHPTNKNCSQYFKKDVKCLNGIYSATINSVIHSSMCCGKDRTSWAYQLFKVYQQYPENLLRSAMAKMRSDQMVSIKKSALRKYGGNCMPMSSSQYQLSTGYIYKFQTKWPYDIFHESYQMMSKLYQWHNDNQIKELNYAVPRNVEGIKAGPVTGGLVVVIHDYFARGQLDFDIEIPDQIIMLDPRLKEKDETYLRIAQRYQDILTSLDQVKLRKLRENVVGENLIDPEVEEDDEIERRELEDKMIKEKRDKEDRDRWNYWNSRKDEFGKRMEEIEVKSQRDEEDKEKYDKRIKFDNEMIIRKEKYAKVIELGEENAPEAIVSEFLNNNETENEKTESDSDKDDNYYESYEDEDNHTIRFQDGTTITLSKEDIESSTWNSEEEEEDEENSKSSNKDSSKMSKKKTSAQKRCLSAIIDDDYDEMQLTDNNKKSKLEEDKIENLSKKPEEKIDEYQIIEKEKEDKFSNNSLDTLSKDLKSSRPLEEEEKDCEEFQVRAKRRKIEETCDNELSKENLIEKTVETVKESNGTRVNDIMNRIYDSNRLEYGGFGVEDSNDMQKRCTRIALLMMREELNEIPVTDSHHAHDYFVVNMFKIFCSLKLSDDDDDNNKTLRSLVNFNNFQIPIDILPLNRNLSKSLIEDIKNNALFPKSNSTIEEFLNNAKESFDQSDDIENIKTVYKYVEEKKEIGATSKQILLRFKSLSKDRLYRIVSSLTKHRLFLRSGVTAVRYIHQNYADPWLINSYKILRLDKESLPPVPQGIIYPTDSEDRNELQTKNNNFDKDTMNKKNEIGDDESSSIIENENENENELKNLAKDNLSKTDSYHSNLLINEGKEISNKVIEDQEVEVSQISNNEANESSTEFFIGRGKMQRKRTSLLQQKDIQKAAKKLDFNTAEAIKVVIKPWIRIDGVLNRRVLDRMLGAVLGYCINHPGIILAKVQRRFVPVLQPFHTTELIEMLVRLECLRWKVLHKPKVTLFSKPAKISLSSATGLDSEDELVIEPEIDASIKFSMFIGNKSYNSDFLT